MQPDKAAAAGTAQKPIAADNEENRIGDLQLPRQNGQPGHGQQQSKNQFNRACHASLVIIAIPILSQPLRGLACSPDWSFGDGLIPPLLEAFWINMIVA